MERKELYFTICSDLSGAYVEVGTCWGGFAEFLAEFTPCSKLFCVDPYKKFDALEYVDGLNTMTQEQMDEKYMSVSERLQRKYGEKITMIRKCSTDVAEMFEDNTLDFVYIDGNHMYTAVLDDLTAWYPKIRDGGILAGDDVESLDLKHDSDGNAFVLHDESKFGCYGVHTALLEFQKNHPEFTFSLEGNQFIWRKSKNAFL
jgi:hypothetical protein